MSKEVDERVVSMQFDNKNFEKNVQTSLSTLDKLKRSLHLPGAAKGLEEVNSTVKGMNMGPLGQAVEAVGMKFSAMQVVAATALMRITNAAIDTGKRIVSAFTIDPVKTGFQEYETQINAVQTILANTSSKGTTLEQVNDALDELNHYADMTIYNFTEMTRNIGTFTAAGVDLDTSVSAIKGIANLAAVSGSTSMQASTAMYQLSQALAAGKVQLMDWNSVVNAGMGGQVFQDALKETARVSGVAIDDMIEKHGSFRETLQEGWLTSEVLTKTLAKFTGDLSEAQLKEMGYTEDQIKEIIKLGQTANDAATKVKTFTQLMDTLKEAAQSGWTQTWEILIGDFEEAKALWTSVSDYFSEALNKSAEARNNMLQAWSDAGGRGMAIDSIKNVFQGLLSVIRPIKEAFREIFPKTTADQLIKITKSIKSFTEKLKLSEKNAANLKATFKGFFAIIDIGLTIIKSVISAVAKLFGGVSQLSGGILGATGAIGNYIVGLRDSIKESNTFGNILGKIADILKTVFNRFVDVLGQVNQKLVAPGFKAFLSLLKGIWKVLQWIGSKVKQVLSSVADGLKEAFQNGDLTSLTAIVSGGLLVMILKKLKDFISNLKNPLEGLSGILDSVKAIFGSVGDALKSWQNELQAKTLLKIAGAIAILAAAILVISTIEPAKLAASLGAMTALFAELMGAMAVFARISGSVKGVFKASAAMLSMSTAVLILSAALKVLSSISWGDLAKSLLGLAATFAILITALTYMSKIDKMGKGASKLFVIATSLVIFASALKILASMSWGDMAKSLVAMAGVFAILLGSLYFMSKIDKAGKGATKMFVIATSLVIFASALKILATMSWSDIGRSIIAMAGIFVILLAAMAIMSKISTFNLGAASILIMANSLILIAIALKIVGSMGWDSIWKSLTGIGATLALMAGVLAVMAAIGPKAIIGAAAMVIMAAAINLLVPPLVLLGTMSWESIIKGLVAIAGAFVIIGAAGILLSGAIVPILGLAGALALVGIATLAFGIGLTAIATGLTALSVSLTAGAASIVAGLTIIITGIIGLIPTIIAAIGSGIVLILNTIASSGKAIFNAVKTILVSLANAFTEAVPAIVKAVFTLLEALLKALVSFIPKLVDAGIKLVVGLLNGIAQNIGKIIEAGINLVVNFLNGIASNLGRVIDAGVNLVLSLIEGILSTIPKIIDAAFTMAIELINGLANSIRENTPLVIDAINNLLGACAEAIGAFAGNFVEAGKQIMSGFAKGIKSSLGTVKDSLLGGVKKVWGKVTGFFGIHSPSKKAAEAGRYIDEGLAVGLNKYADKAGNAATNVAKETSNSLTDALSAIPSVIDADAQPTIRPVLDLSEVEAGASEVDDLFGFNPAVGVLANANAIGASVNKGQNGSTDVISAIKDLGRRISGGSGNVYNINGVTYDDGTAVSSAVENLIRAARIERRI